MSEAIADIESYCWQPGLLLTLGVSVDKGWLFADNGGLLTSNVVADNGVIADAGG